MTVKDDGVVAREAAQASERLAWARSVFVIVNPAAAGGAEDPQADGAGGGT